MLHRNLCFWIQPSLVLKPVSLRNKMNLFSIIVLGLCCLFCFCFLTSPSAGKDTLPAFAANAIRAYRPNSLRTLCKAEVPNRGAQQMNVLLMAISEHAPRGWGGWSWCAVFECLTLQQGASADRSRDGNSSSYVCLCTPLFKVEQSIWTKVYFNWD